MADLKDPWAISVRNFAFGEQALQKFVEERVGLKVKTVTTCKSTSIMYAAFENESMCQQVIDYINAYKPYDPSLSMTHVEMAPTNWKEMKDAPVPSSRPDQPHSLQPAASSASHQMTQESRAGQALYLPPLPHPPPQQQPWYHHLLQQYPGGYQYPASLFPPGFNPQLGLMHARVHPQYMHLQHMQPAGGQHGIPQINTL